MFETVLVADRGETAVRVLSTCRRLGVKGVAVYSQADVGARHVREADEAVLLGPASAAESYLDVDRVVEAASVSGAQAVHPGRTFLAGDAAAARRITAAGLCWIGPDPSAIAVMGDGTATLPVIAAPGLRHLEVPVLGLADGRIVALGERDCTVRRSGRTLLGETPAPALTPELRHAVHRAARQAAETVELRGAATVEFLVGPASGRITFLQTSGRLPVEHALTELVTGIDLVEQQLRVAAGDPPSFDPDAPPAPRGHAVGVRVYAESLPDPGTLRRWRMPFGEGIRVDAGYAEGDEVPEFYDPLLAGLSVWAPDRPAALERLRGALAQFEIEGPRANLPAITAALDSLPS